MKVEYYFIPFGEDNKNFRIKVNKTGKIWEIGEHSHYKHFKVIEVVDDKGYLHEVFEDELVKIL